MTYRWVYITNNNDLPMDGIVSLGIFVVEFTMTLYVVIRTNDYEIKNSLVVLLFLLQSYQLAEFLMCFGLSAQFLPRMAFMIITFLPPMGHYLTNILVRSKSKDFIPSFLVGTIFASYYGIMPESVQLINCNPFFAVYNYRYPSVYGLFYYLVILYSIVKLVRYSEFEISRWDLQSKFLLGYLLFLVPMMLTVFIDHKYISSIPSIMCKYAISLAIMLTAMAHTSIQGEK